MLKMKDHNNSVGHITDVNEKILRKLEKGTVIRQKYLKWSQGRFCFVNFRTDISIFNQIQKPHK